MLTRDLIFDYDNQLQVYQITPTIQCEGYKTGVPSLLIRLMGCNLICSMCDSKFTWNYKNAKKIYNLNNKDQLLSDIKLEIKKYNISNLMITGGEPTLYKHNPLFLSLLTETKFKTVEIETNGTNLINFPNTPNLFLNISPKLDINSYPTYDHYLEMIRSVKFILNSNQYKYVLKIVDDQSNRNRLFTFLKDVGIKENLYSSILVMPKTPNYKNIETIPEDSKDEYFKILQEANLATVKLCMEWGFRFTPRVHLYLFNNEFEKFD